MQINNLVNTKLVYEKIDLKGNETKLDEIITKPLVKKEIQKESQIKTPTVETTANEDIYNILKLLSSQNVIRKEVTYNDGEISTTITKYKSMVPIDEFENVFSNTSLDQLDL